MNAYEMSQEVRDNIAEATAAHWQDVAILRKINGAQRTAFHLISQTPGDWFVKTELITPVASVVTLPTDCAKPVYMEEVATGTELPIGITVRERRHTRGSGVTAQIFDLAGQDAYLLEGTIEVNKADYTNQVRLWYERRIPDLHFGISSAGGATSLTLEDGKQHSLIDDYYVGMGIEVVGGTGAGTRTTVSDYVGSTRVLTLAAGTFGADSVYGLLSVLPREACDVITIAATTALLAKPNSTVDPNYFKFWANQYQRAVDNLEDWCTQRLKNSIRTRGVEDYG